LALAEEVRDGDLVLVKGSRGVATEKVISGCARAFPLVGNESDKLKLAGQTRLTEQ